MVEYKCDLQLDGNCTLHYRYYSGVYENPDYDTQKYLAAKRAKKPYNVSPGNYTEVNSIRLCSIEPLDTAKDFEKIEESSSEYPINRYFNVCPNCMRALVARIRKNTGLNL